MGRRVQKDALYAAFEAKGFNATRAAKVCDMSQSYFSNCETSGIPNDIAAKLKSRLEIDVETLPEYIEETEPDEKQIAMDFAPGITKQDMIDAVRLGVEAALMEYFGRKEAEECTTA